MSADPPLYPPRVTPAKKPLRFPSNLIKLVGDNLQLIPAQAYHEHVVIAPGRPRMAFFTGPEALKTLLHSRRQEFPKGWLQNTSLEPLMGRPMLSSEGEEWRWQRGVAAPLFGHEELMQYGPIMSAAAEATVAKWRAAVPSAVHYINRDMLRTAFRVISNTMLVGGAEDALLEIEKGHADYYKGANWWVLYSLLGLPQWLPRPGGRLMRAQVRRVRQAIARIVAGRGADAGKDTDLLGRMRAAVDPGSGRRMSDQLLGDNIISFLVAGYDTTAFSLSWTLYLISQSPEWEARMLEEVRAVVGSGPVTSAHFRSLVVTQQVYNESLRLFPTAPIIIRDILRDEEIDGVLVPAGTMGLIPIYAVHRHRRYWSDPDRFDPGRFSAANPIKPTRYQFLPFGVGPRICIGAAFAMIEATIMLATFIRAAHFEIAPDFRPQPVARIFLFPKHELPMRVTMRP
jgi:cytochrome P450